MFEQDILFIRPFEQHRPVGKQTFLNFKFGIMTIDYPQSRMTNYEFEMPTTYLSHGNSRAVFVSLTPMSELSRRYFLCNWFVTYVTFIRILVCN